MESGTVRAARSELALRCATAAVIGPVFALAAGSGGPWLAASTLLVGMVGLHEVAGLAFRGSPRGRAERRATFAGAALYVAAACTAVVWLGSNRAPHGAALWLLMVVWSSDISAYAVGRTVGGPRLAPSISLGKTVSGLAGAMVGGGAAAAAARGIAPGIADVPTMFLLGCALGLLGQLGDLAESALKRRAGVKDSGSVLPGHGGVLDRVDALMAAALALAVFLRLG